MRQSNPLSLSTRRDNLPMTGLERPVKLNPMTRKERPALNCSYTGHLTTSPTSWLAKRHEPIRIFNKRNFTPKKHSLEFMVMHPRPSYILLDPSRQRHNIVFLTAGGTDLHLASKGVQVPRLQVDGSGTLKPAGKTFSGADARDNTPGSDALDLILAVPSDEVAIVDEVGFAFFEL